MAHRLSPAASTDLDDIWVHLARETGNEAIADRMIDAITERLYLLAKHPKLGRARDDLGRGIRSFVAGDYVIVYELQGEDVRVLRIVHSRRNLPGLFGA